MTLITAISSPMSDHVDALSSLHREDEIATSPSSIGGDELVLVLVLLDRHAEDTKYCWHTALQSSAKSASVNVGNNGAHRSCFAGGGESTMATERRMVIG